MNRISRLNDITQSSETQEKLSRRNLKWTNQFNKGVWIVKNESIIYCVLKHAVNKNLEHEHTAVINQVRVFKQIMLSHKLVGFSSNKVMKEARSYKERSCVIQNLKFEHALKPSRQLFKKQ